MPDDIRERLLDDAVHREFERSVDWARRSVDVEFGVDSGRAGALDQLRQLGQRRLRSDRRRAIAVAK
jgi:hypothetical protein